MYGEQEIAGRERRRKENMRKRRIKRRINLCAKLVIAAAVLVVACNFISGLSIWKGKSLDDFLAGIKNVKAEDTKLTFVDAEDANLTYPTAREGDELYRALHERAETDDAYSAILDNYDAYPEELLSALCSNPEMLPFVEGYLASDGKVHGGLTKEELDAKIPLLIQWDERWGYAPYGESNIALSGCAPTCLSMVVVSLTKDSSATPDQIADYAMQEGYYLQGTGTTWAIMTEGAAHYGVTGQELSLDEGVIMRHLQAGEPIICSMRPGDFTTAGHFIVLSGTVDGKIIVNDPNSRARSQVLWDYDTIASQIKNLWAFTGNQT